MPIVYRKRGANVQVRDERSRQLERLGLVAPARRLVRLVQHGG
jgi:hypothetical protein